MCGPYLTALSVLCATGCMRGCSRGGAWLPEKVASVSCFSQGLERKALSVGTVDHEL